MPRDIGIPFKVNVGSKYTGLSNTSGIFVNSLYFIMSHVAMQNSC